MLLSNVILGLGVRVEKDLKVSGVVADSKKVEPGNIFVAYSGVGVDGHDFIEEAVSRGAVAVVGEKDLRSVGVPYFRVESGRFAWAKMTANWYENPEKYMKFVGVTGTDGKTTTSNLIYRFLLASSKKVGLVSTISALIGKEELDTGLHVSSPDPDQLWKVLSEMKKAGTEYVVLETTSHGLAQERFGDIEFVVGVLTNLAHDHLEYHETIQDYAKAKAKLFSNCQISVLNKQAKMLDVFSKAAADKVVLYDRLTETRKANYELTEDKIWHKFEILVYGDWRVVKTSLLGDFNQENILAAIKAALSLGVSLEAIQTTLSQMPQLPGRFEMVKNDRDLKLVVDFAHTEQGARGVLSLIRERLIKPEEKLIAVFGCNGERDRSKRAPMGKVVAEIADFAVITAEDPRKEDINQIFDDIYSGCVEAGGKLGEKIFREDNRRKAIAFAVKKLAKKGDWVIFMGKGHEKSMNIGGVERPWDDVTEVLKAVALRKSRS